MSRFTDKTIDQKSSTIVNDDKKDIKPWYEGLIIKGLIIMPSVLFIVTFFIFNTPKNPQELLVILIYPILLISLAVILFFCNSKLN